jgi:hypothetical protein
MGTDITKQETLDDEAEEAQLLAVVVDAARTDPEAAKWLDERDPTGERRRHLGFEVTKTAGE